MPAQAARAFDVVSIKHNVGGARPFTLDRSATRFVATNLSLQTLIQMAYDMDASMSRHLLIGRTTLVRPCMQNCTSREQILSARFDIDARVAPGESAGAEELTQMLRALLKERFALQTHMETRDVPVYAVTVVRPGQLGPRLRPSEHDCDGLKAKGVTESELMKLLDSRGRPICQGVDVSQLGVNAVINRYAGPISSLLKQIRNDVDRLLVDSTELVGLFEWELTYEAPGLRDLVPVQKAPAIDVAFREQLGLRLDSHAAPFDVLVIDSVQMPSPN
jgi:uncharacterized protein (TIGR03435 family)